MNLESHHHHFDSLPSTQDWAKEHFKTLDLNKFNIISASEQTKGRGQFDRHWHSPKGGAYTTFCFLVSDHQQPMNAISLVTGLSFAEALQKLGLIVKLKWPNDLYIDGKKAGGILVETKEITGGKVFFVGVGLNINLSLDDLKAAHCEATSISAETQKSWSIKPIMSGAENIFKRNLAIFLKEGFQPFIQDYEALSYLAGKTIVIEHANQNFEGHYQKIDEQGSLVLKLKDGSLKPFFSGQIISWE